MQADELIARMSRDPQLDAFNSENKEHLFPEFLWHIINRAEIDVLKDTKCKVKEQDITAVVDQRAVNAPDDLLQIVTIRYKEPDDEALVEGIPIRIISEEDMY